MKTSLLVALTAAVTVLIVGLLALAITLHGFVLSTLWGWFVVPFFAAPALPIAMAIGLCCVRSLVLPFRQRPKEPSKKGDWKQLGGLMAESFAAPAVLLAIGWVAKDFL